MQQLTDRSAAYLDSTTPRASANISLVHIYDQSTAPAGTVRFKGVLDHFSSRLSQTPLFRHRLQRVPFGLDRPYWVEDENFDIEDHVHHVALPKPGDWRQFCIQISRINARVLDLGRPVWEIYVIEGLDSFTDLPKGSFALLLKTHLSAIDVGGLSALSAALHDRAAIPSAMAPDRPWFPESPPSELSLLVRGALVGFWSLRWMTAPLRRVLSRTAPVARLVLGRGLLHGAADNLTRFNSAVSSYRVFDTRRFLQCEFEEICALVDSATVNEAVLAVCGGALRRYLLELDELPPNSMVADVQGLAVPCIGPTGEAPNGHGFFALGTEIIDPVLRLESIHRQVERRAPAHGHQADRPGCAVVFVTEDLQPQFLCGAQLMYCSAILPISDGMGLTLAVSCANGRVVISPSCCRELMPDPDRFAQCLRESFQELLEGARLCHPPRRKRVTVQSRRRDQFAAIVEQRAVAPAPEPANRQTRPLRRRKAGVGPRRQAPTG